MEELFTKFIDLQESVGQARVMVARKPIVDGRRAKFMYLPYDLATLESDLSLDRLHLNGGLDTHYVHAVKSPLGKRYKPLGDDE